MKIGIDASRAFGEKRTGTENYSFELITRILALPEAKEHEWILYTKSQKQIPNFKNVKQIVVPLKYLWTQAGLAGRTWIDRPDVLWIPAHTLPVLRIPGLKTVVTIHGIEYEWLPAYENSLQRWYLPLSTRYAVRTATKIIAVSKFTQAQIIEKMQADPGKIKMIWEGTNKEITNHKTQVLNRYNLDYKHYLLFVGTVQPRKNLARLIEAFAMLLDNNLNLVIAGKPGWNFQEVIEAPKKFRVEDRVIITGYLQADEIQTLMENALAYVQPSITEGFGLPIIEAMQAGIPVVSSKGGALAEVTGDAGLLFDPYNINELSKCLNEITKDMKLRNKLIKLGFERAKMFSWDRAAKETLQALLSCS